MSIYIFKNNHYIFRKDPIPNTGKFKRIGKIFKHPRTTQEMRNSYEYPEFIRLKRKKLPTLYDDILVNNIKRSWKRSKKRKQFN